MSNASIAANAYANAAKLTSALESGQDAAPQEGAFGALVKNAIQEVADTGAATQVQSLDLLQGKANVVDVVTAVAETELALETVVSVRDKVISAYEEIMRMPI